MNALAPTPSSVQRANTDPHFANGPCVGIRALQAAYPQLVTRASGEISTDSFLSLLKDIGTSWGIRTLFKLAITKGTKANGKSRGDWFDANDLRHTFIFDTLATGIVRLGFNQTRLDEMMTAAKDGGVGPAEIARMVRAAKLEQSAPFSAVIKTLGEYALLQTFQTGLNPTPASNFRALIEQGQVTPHFNSGARKTLPRMLFTTTVALAHYGWLAATHSTDLPHLTPIPGLTPLDAGASAALAPARKCPIPWVHGRK